MAAMCAVRLTKRFRYSVNCLLPGWMDGRKQIMPPTMHSFAAFSAPISYEYRQ